MRHVANTLWRALLLGPVVMFAGACFNAPADPVQFACDPDDAPECPGGYECRIDGCCHREDTPDDDAVGECKLSAGSAGNTNPPTPPDPTTEDATTSSGSTGGGTDTTGDTGATTSAGTTSTDSDTSATDAST
ncbi:hypothetical protein [Nannocystis radixulma]|uniref:Uncharacterized protein n=1 Tax=Nannocystis radixulma TaxID=2995305 RepID=A0ABT5BI73_9BACT|nr:hypothetical protein [Nannocystis radixulma]MDC0673865.1 hypothetical protein [Nannocystis radixulma]